VAAVSSCPLVVVAVVVAVAVAFGEVVAVLAVL
jgi:hypothetical protein